MLVAATEQQAVVRYEQGRPEELRWRDESWRVLDVPTRIGVHDDAAYSPLVTHLPSPWPGWRFTARSDDGTSYVFDIRELSDGRCEVLRVYE
ncbi:hypothetical protein MF406_11290 [Georgenia sp. TF02-10]|uniref:hypothetical protein n=1 Tax=Georgenia sp. TF02-10 TaxID=2917725 RepID=UPI001FA73AE6|nr:hypothetical protein [Georgenia sp. TF02-10]UNX53572.1 hypothetical protein MF406_11290 [Georgenia sp. TF02-10]